MTSIVHTAGRLNDVLQPMKDQLVQQAYALVKDDKSVSISDVSQAMDAVLGHFDRLPPALDAKVAIGRMEHRLGPNYVGVKGVAAATATVLTGVIAWSLAKKVDPTLFEYAALVPPFLMSLAGIGWVGHRGAPLESASQVTLQTAKEAAGLDEPTAQELVNQPA